MSYPYVEDGFRIRNTSDHAIKCFVSSYNGGSDEWYDLSSSYKGDSWKRNGWEVVAFKNENDTRRVGFYLNTRDKTTYIVFRSFDNVEIHTSD
ncbi:hypothetical protein NLI96_g1168 [Meripilus lineatus]|uniref:Uncharacterized protein n=1 Tax=Meripilus lineatus TaxID=2056292 RepID=A0AAD5YN76_9APHY|nr:hypothetical protein NLI96_g1168 [Physisporinus lineatus]